jgi:hypothetical protein
VVNAYNSKYPRGGNQEDHNLRPAWAKSETVLQQINQALLRKPRDTTRDWIAIWTHSSVLRKYSYFPEQNFVPRSQCCLCWPLLGEIISLPYYGMTSEKNLFIWKEKLTQSHDTSLQRDTLTTDIWKSEKAVFAFFKLGNMDITWISIWELNQIRTSSIVWRVQISSGKKNHKDAWKF